MNEPGPQGLSREELAALARTDAGVVERLERLGLLQHDEAHRFATGDVHRIRLFEGFRRAGVDLEALAAARTQGLTRFDSYHQLHPAPTPASARTYGEVQAELGDRAPLLARLMRALSLAEPGPSDRLTQEDEDMLLQLVAIIDATGEQDLGLRVARLFGDNLRRTMQGIVGIYGEAAERPRGRLAHASSDEAHERFMMPWHRYAQLAPSLGRWLTGRLLSDAIDAFSVEMTERLLAEAGIVPTPADVPDAVAFVDLTGFTRMAAEQGDEPAAKVALEFGQLAAEISNDHDGRLVKLLGDGALLHFTSSPQAVEATLELVSALPDEGLPTGHAGIDAGPVVIRDGDVFGRTVNLASRLSDRAEPGWVLMSAAAAAAASPPPGPFRFEPLGAERLAGFPEPIELVRVVA